MGCLQGRRGGLIISLYLFYNTRDVINFGFECKTCQKVYAEEVHLIFQFTKKGSAKNTSDLVGIIHQTTVEWSKYLRNDFL